MQATGDADRAFRVRAVQAVPVPSAAVVVPLAVFDVTSPDGCAAPFLGGQLIRACATITVGDLTCTMDSDFYIRAITHAGA